MIVLLTNAATSPSSALTCVIFCSDQHSGSPPPCEVAIRPKRAKIRLEFLGSFDEEQHRHYRISITKRVERNALAKDCRGKDFLQVLIRLYVSPRGLRKLRLVLMASSIRLATVSYFEKVVETTMHLKEVSTLF